MRRTHPNPQQLVLVIGGHGTPLSSLAERTRRLGYRVVRAKTPLDALELADERGYRFGTALVEPSLPVVDLKRALAELRERSDSDNLVFIATGNQPDTEGREQLRRAAVNLALWEPVGNHALRFLLNRVLSGERDGWLRAELRVPTEIPAKIWNAGREKLASIYSLSNGGAFLETACPCVRGAEIAIELPLPRGAVTVAARVLYTNVPGNLHSGRLPNGMGIRFTDASAEALLAIRRAVSDQAASFVI